ncbi:small-conductance mechanosensitive channel [Microbacterium sp. 1154]|uniref:hypothetical protein n=1 Tax=Microbacterium sp. 1154 TaxID=2817733 RepID=UPI0028621D7D|nr:hypothetical protein [Microbacterium sp. 1154]MDR6691503.1 small-conductance mechanosensitive channel [Microbacterium sp. 1154]
MIFVVVGVVALIAALVSLGMLAVAVIYGDRRPVATFATSLFVSLLLVAASIAGCSS